MNRGGVVALRFAFSVALRFAFYFYRFVLLRVAVVVFAAALPYSFRLPLLSGIRGGVRNSRDDYNTVIASRTVPSYLEG